MPQRDLIEQRRHRPTVPTDVNDPARFGQMVETTKDALVEVLREFFNQNGFTTQRRGEAPAVEKFAVGFGEGLDPYETFTRIVQMFPDIRERLPLIAVTTASGQNRRMTVGRPFIAHTQAPPRVTGSANEPFALSEALAGIVDITVTSAPDTYTVSVDGEVVTATTASGTTADAATEIARALRASIVNLVFRVELATTTTIRLTHRQLGVDFAVTVSANLSAAVVQEAGAATTHDTLVFRTRPGGLGSYATSVIQFPRSRFATTEDMSALSAAAICRVFNEQALYAYARVVAVGGNNRVLIETGGKLGGRTPNEIEILDSSTASLLTALGLTAGQRDDSRNPLRPVMNRSHASKALSLTIDVMGEGPNERLELCDLLTSAFIFFLEDRHFTLYGRGIFSPDDYPDEHYQISIGQEIQTAGETDFPRGEDTKNRIHAGRLILPVTTTWYIDRPVLVTSGPSAGQSWTLERANVTQDDTLPGRS